MFRHPGVLDSVDGDSEFVVVDQRSPPMASTCHAHRSRHDDVVLFSALALCTCVCFTEPRHVPLRRLRSRGPQALLPPSLPLRMPELLLSATAGLIPTSPLRPKFLIVWLHCACACAAVSSSQHLHSIVSVANTPMLRCIPVPASFLARGVTRRRSQKPTASLFLRDNAADKDGAVRDGDEEPLRKGVAHSCLRLLC